MKKIIKIAIVVYLLFIDFAVFAQIGEGPGDEDDNGSTGLEGGDPPTAPINIRLWIFIIIGIAYAFLLFKKMNQIKRPRQ